jgi:ubiquinone/menaquinone biosynthesis C-methylase UbiE
MRTSQSHVDEIVDQFTRQAKPFASAAPIRDEAALQLVVDFAGTTADDTVVEVACGPGLLACAFARRARHVSGIDVTPAMLACAREEAQRQGATNMSWVQADVNHLPCREASASIVSSRFAVHHFLDPLTVVREMRRIARPGGRVVVIDPAPAAEKAEAFNVMERLRDSSHVRALTLDELLRLFAAADLPAPRMTRYRLEGDLDGLLSRSFFPEENGAAIRGMFERALTDDHMDLAVRRDGALIRYGYPVAVLVSAVPR